MFWSAEFGSEISGGPCISKPKCVGLLTSSLTTRPQSGPEIGNDPFILETKFYEKDRGGDGMLLVQIKAK